MFRRFFLSLFALGTFPIETEAASLSINVNNAGFETQVLNNNTFFASAAPPTSWSAYDPFNLLAHDYNSMGVLNPGTSLYTNEAPQGNNVALIFLWPQNYHPADFGRPVGISQTLGDSLLANTQYTLTVQVGNIASDGNPNYSLTGFPGYQVQLLANNVVLSQDNNTLSPAEGSFLLSTVQFTTGATHAQLGQALQIRLINLNTPNSGIEVNFDDVKLQADSVPEPGSLALCALGLGGVAFAARRARLALS